MDTINQLPAANSIDGVNDLLPIYQNSSVSTLSISRNTYLGLASQPVGLSDTQTLTNKTITSPTISGPTLSGTIIGTYTIGGTPTFPSSVATLSGTQTLTNKTLTSPTINSPTITNATITADTVSGYTTSNTGTIYGIGITTGQISSNLTATGTLTVSGLITASNGLTVSSGVTQLLPTLKNPYKFSVYRNAGATSVNTAGGGLITFDTEVYDTGSNYSVSTGKFTAHVAGFYQLNALVGNSAATGTAMEIYFYKNGSLFITGETVVVATASTNGTLLNLSPPPLSLSANDYIQVYFVGGSGSTIKVGQAYCYFGGYLVSAT